MTVRIYLTKTCSLYYSSIDYYSILGLPSLAGFQITPSASQIVFISKRLDIGSYDMASARGKGRPPADIPREKLEYFTEMGFTRVELADIFGVCVRTIGKFLNMYSLKREDRWHDLNGRFFQCFLCIYIKYYESCKQLVNTCQLLS